MPNWALAVMSPNNDRVAYTWAPADGAYELRVVGADGSAAHPLLPRQSEYEPDPIDWTPDGRYVSGWLLNTGAHSLSSHWSLHQTDRTPRISQQVRWSAKHLAVTGRAVRQLRLVAAGSVSQLGGRRP